MPSIMTQAKLELVEAATPNAQAVAVLEATGIISMKHALVPEPDDTEVRVLVKYVGICGSDLEAYRGTRSPEFMSTPARLGHEVAGVLDKVGKNVLGLRVGDRVTCRYVWGAFANYIVCKPFNVKVLPPTIPMLDISLIEILPGVIHAAELSKITPRTSVLITGQGVSGLVLTQIFKLYSPRVLVVTDIKDKNLELARKYGATHTYKLPSTHSPTMDTLKADFPDGFDVVVPCLLEGEGMNDALECMALAGKIVMYGCIASCNFDFFKLHRKRGEIFSTEPRRDLDMRSYLDQGVGYVLDGLVNTAEMVTHIYPLARVGDAFALRNDRSEGNHAIHILVDCDKNADPEKVIVVAEQPEGWAEDKTHAPAAAGGAAAAP